jgi:hypothetical protein
VRTFQLFVMESQKSLASAACLVEFQNNDCHYLLKKPACIANSYVKALFKYAGRIIGPSLINLPKMIHKAWSSIVSMVSRAPL